MEMIIEDIPENNFSNTQINKKNQPMKKNQIDYDGILRKMGMREVKGKLFWEKNRAQSNENFIPYEPGQRKKNVNTQQQKSGVNTTNNFPSVHKSPNSAHQSLNSAHQSPNSAHQSLNSAHQSPNSAYQNSYIYNKYFKNEFKQPEEIRKPRNLIEYRNMLIRRIIEKKRIEQIKSRQMFFK
jgi:hypothetical protein